jgi:opacity protein-like surface antigen
MYGGDVDLQLDLAHQARDKFYLLGGVGWYREQIKLRSVSLVDGTFCGWFGCGPGVGPVFSTVLDSTSSWTHAWNAGIGWELAVADGASFFIEARYERMKPYDSRLSFVPVTLGFRF